MASAPHTLASLPDISRNVATWVAEVASLTQPDHVHWCDGSAAERDHLRDSLVRRGELLPLNPETFPRCYLFRSDPADVARVEHLTFVCTQSQEDAGPNNNWLAPATARAPCASSSPC